MLWLAQFQAAQPVAAAMIVLSAVAIAGHALGSVRVRKVSIGVAGVLFAGIFFGQVGFTMEPRALEFTREFGLILFVYTIGMQVGRGFFASLRAQGLPMNLLAAGIILLGGLIAVSLGYALDLDMPAILGVLAGATTNTPSLAATEQALKQLPGISPAELQLPGLGYAVAYPGAIAGLILSMIILRLIFRIDVDAERAAMEQRAREEGKAPERMSVRIDNTNLDGLRLSALPGLAELQITVSRIRRAGTSEVFAPREETAVGVGDVLLAVGRPRDLESFRLIAGAEVDEDLTALPGPISSRRVVVTRPAVLGKTLGDLSLRAVHGVTVTRVTRSDLQLPADATLRLQFGDMLQLVGREEDIERATDILGNSARALNQTNLLAIFVGIALGVLVGLYPFHLPGVPVPLRLGLAGGPLIVAILISRIGHIGPIVWHMPMTANLMLRELGLTLFLACVGLSSGARFLETLASGEGAIWAACGAAITLVPVLLGGIVGRMILKLDFASLCGLLAGSNTDPPALSFATEMSGSEAPTVAYATVYPMTMLLRLLVAQVLTIVVAG
ncbi:MAG TPA: putative transporter [Thermoanaerobaculia bacterium]|nr:putative transporter [Thermoanaerobaculia bacterium]